MNTIASINELQYKSERLLLIGAFVTFAGFCVMYMYFLSLSVLHVVISKETEATIHQVNSEIAELEAEYMEIQNSLSLDMVEQSGYIAATEKVFIDRASASFVTQR